MIFIKKIFKFIKLIVAIVLVILVFRKAIDIKNEFINKSNIKTDYKTEWNDIDEDDLKTIKKVIKLANDRIGLEYAWGAKGEIMTDERLDELIECYGKEHYPLKREEYIGKQVFDCSGLTYWLYKKTTKVNIGYSTANQQEILKDYKVSGNLHPGDLIYTTGHVVLYIGNGKVINSANQYKYPTGGVKKESLLMYRNGIAYRPIDYINDNK